MSAVYADIQIALESKLKTYTDANDIPVEWPNVTIDPTGHSEYLSAYHLPGETGVLGLAAGDVEEHFGIFQVTVNIGKTARTGTARARELVDDILTLFAKAQVLSGVIIENSWASAAVEINQGWYSVPVSIRYRRFA